MNTVIWNVLGQSNKRWNDLEIECIKDTRYKLKKENTRLCGTKIDLRGGEILQRVVDLREKNNPHSHERTDVDKDEEWKQSKIQ